MLISIQDAEGPMLDPIVLAAVEMEVVPRNGEYIRIAGTSYVVTMAMYEVKLVLPRNGGGFDHSGTVVWVARR